MQALTIDQLKTRLTNSPPGSIIIEKLPNGVIMVDDTPQTKQEYLERDYPDLIGQTITLTEAAKKYAIPRGTLNNWYNSAGYIQPVENSYPSIFDEAEIAYLISIYHQRRASGSKAPLLDDDGLPYEIKHPKLADYRRRKKG